MAEARTFVTPDFKFRRYDWNKRLVKKNAKYPWLGSTWVGGARIKMRFQQLLGVKDGIIYDKGHPGAEVFLLIALKKGGRSWRYFLSDGEVYHDLDKHYGDNPEPCNCISCRHNFNKTRNSHVAFIPWETTSWVIVPKSKRRRLTTQHQQIIKEMIPWAMDHLMSE